MRFRRKGRFADLVERQLALFEREHAGLLAAVEARLREYDAAPADEAEEHYGDFLDLAQSACEELEALRDGYARTLPEEAAEEYAAVFDRAARRRYPRVTVELE